MPAGIRRMMTKASTSIATWPSRMLNWFMKIVFAAPRESTLASSPVMTSAPPPTTTVMKACGV